MAASGHVVRDQSASFIPSQIVAKIDTVAPDGSVESGGGLATAMAGVFCSVRKS